MRIKTTNDIILTDNSVDKATIWTKEGDTFHFDATNKDDDEFHFEETVFINLQEIVALVYTRKEAKEVKNNG